MDMKGVLLRDAIDNYSQYEVPNKIVAACKLVREICDGGQKAIIWSTFVHNLEMLANPFTIWTR